MANAAAARALKIGIIGIGVGGSEMLPIMAASAEFDLVAGADIAPQVREAFTAAYQARSYATAEELCKDPDVEAVWISTPNRFHWEHTVLAAQHGKHIIVEKPMAISLKEGEAMIEAAAKYGVKLIPGHTPGFTPAVRAMRHIANSGELGALQAINIYAYSDWMLRARTKEETDFSQGGGIPYRQGPHQVDSARVIGGGLVRSVRGSIGQWLPGRTMPGFYSAYLEFENGVPAILSHNGYGYFLTTEFMPYGTNQQILTTEAKREVRERLRDGAWDDEQAKNRIRMGGDQAYYASPDFQKKDRWMPSDFGVAIVTCERGDIRQSPLGLYVYGDDGVREQTLTYDRLMGPIEPRVELLELYEAVVLGKPVYHTGEWGMATLEVCLALIQSAQERREIRLSHQVPIHPDYDNAPILAKEFER